MKLTPKVVDKLIREAITPNVQGKDAGPPYFVELEFLDPGVEVEPGEEPNPWFTETAEEWKARMASEFGLKTSDEDGVAYARGELESLDRVKQLATTWCWPADNRLSGGASANPHYMDDETIILEPAEGGGTTAHLGGEYL